MLNLGFACDSIAAARGLGLWQAALSFGRPFNSYNGRLARLTIQSLNHWRKAAEIGTGANLDNFGPWWVGFHVGRWFAWRNYRLIAQHLSVGPVTLSWVHGTWLPTSGPRLFLGARR